MPADIEFHVPGKPEGKGRPRAGKSFGGHARLYTPEKTVAYEGLIAFAGQQAMAGRTLLLGPVFVHMEITLPVPNSWSNKRKALALAGSIYPTTKPDIDNVEKAIFDGLNGIVWRDDVQVVDVVKRKTYGEVPGVLVRISPLEGEGA